MRRRNFIFYYVIAFVFFLCSAAFAAKTQLIIIADIHNNPYVQKAIYERLDAINKAKEIDGIFLEGGFGKSDFSFLRTEKQAKRLLDLGLLSGAEFFAYKNHVKAIGIENPGVYLKALGAYISLVKESASYNALFGMFSSTVLLDKILFDAMRLRLSYQRWKALRSIDNLDYLPGIKPVVDFYDSADERTLAFAKTILNEIQDYPGLYVAVIGGYHFEKLEKELKGHVDVRFVYPLGRNVPDFSVIKPIINYRHTNSVYMPVLPLLSLAPGKTYVKTVDYLTNFSLRAKAFCMPIVVRDKWIASLRERVNIPKSVWDFIKSYGPGMWDIKARKMRLFFEIAPLNRDAVREMWNSLADAFSLYFNMQEPISGRQIEAMVRFHEGLHAAISRDERVKPILREFKKRLGAQEDKFGSLFEAFYLAYGRMPKDRAIEEMLILYCQWQYFFSLGGNFLEAYTDLGEDKELLSIFQRSYAQVLRILAPVEMVELSKTRLDIASQVLSFLVKIKAIKDFPVDSSIDWLIKGSAKPLLAAIPNFKDVPLYVASIESRRTLFQDNRFNMAKDIKESEEISILAKGSFGSAAALMAGAILCKELDKKVSIALISDGLFYVDEDILQHLISVSDAVIPEMDIRGSIEKNRLVLTEGVDAFMSHKGLHIVVGLRGIDSRLFESNKDSVYYVVSLANSISTDMARFLRSKSVLNERLDDISDGLIMMRLPNKRPVRPDMKQIVALNSDFDFDLAYKDIDYLRTMEQRYFNDLEIEAEAIYQAKRLVNLWRKMPQGGIVLSDAPQWSAVQRILALKNIRIIPAGELNSEMLKSIRRGGIFVPGGRAVKWLPLLIKCLGFRSGISVYWMMQDIKIPFISSNSQVFYPDAITSVLLDAFSFHKAMFVIANENTLVKPKDMPLNSGSNKMFNGEFKQVRFSSAGKRYFPYKQKILPFDMPVAERDVLSGQSRLVYKDVVKALFKRASLMENCEFLDSSYPEITSRIIKADKYTAFVPASTYYSFVAEDEGHVSFLARMADLSMHLKNIGIEMDDFVIEYLSLKEGTLLYSIAIPDAVDLTTEEIEEMNSKLKSEGLFVKADLLPFAFKRSLEKIVCVAPLAVEYRVRFNMGDVFLEELLRERGGVLPSSLRLKKEFWDLANELTGNAAIVDVKVTMPLNVMEYKRKKKKELCAAMSKAFSGDLDYFEGMSKKQLLAVLFTKLPVVVQISDDRGNKLAEHRCYLSIKDGKVRLHKGPLRVER